MPNQRRRPAPSDARPAAASRPLPPPWAVAVTLLVVAAVVAAGVLIDLAQHPAPPSSLAGCRTSRQLAPDLYRSPPAMCIDTGKRYTATIDTTKGTFTVSLLPKQAPRTVNNFVVLAVNGYFNGQRFFDTKDWEVRAGDPTETGRGGPGYMLPAEPVARGESWPTGSVGMARLPDGSLSGSQLFVTRTAWPGGNPSVSYNHFGTVSQGFDVVSQLGGSDRIQRVSVSRT